MRIFTKTLATLSMGILMILGLIVLMPTMTIGVFAGYCAGVVSLVLTSELIDRFESR